MKKACPYCLKRKLNTVKEIVHDKFDCIETIDEKYEWMVDAPRPKPLVMSIKQAFITLIAFTALFGLTVAIAMLIFTQAILWLFCKDMDDLKVKTATWATQGYCRTCFKVWAN